MKADTIHRPGNDVGVKNIAFDKFDVGRNVLKVASMAGAEIVQHANGVTALDQCRRNMRTDEARAASDQNRPHESILD